jgi:geranylgeranyl diphosphate synthase type I
VLRRRFDDELARFLTAKGSEIPEAELLFDEIRRMVGAGGKRLRPLFCYWGHRAAGGPDSPAIVSAATALELLHTFAIVHDDVMDQSATRRGIPSVHAKFGLDTAVLVGDLALVLADAALVESGFEPTTFYSAFEHYSRMRRDVIAGQFLDITASERPTVTVDEARRIARLKSGRYTVEEPLHIGAALAGADERFHSLLGDFGARIGEAFQHNDDVQGTFGDESTIGKPVDSDIRQGKRHVLFAYALESLGERDRGYLIDHWGGGASLTADDIARCRALLVSSGARERVMGLIDELHSEALAVLDSLPASDEEHHALRDLASIAVGR